MRGSQATQAALLHREHRTTALDFGRDLAVHVRRHASDAARQNLAAFGDKFTKQIRVLVIDRFRRDIDATAGHGAVGATKGRAAFGGFWLHGYLVSRCSVGRFINGLYFLSSSRFGVRGLFLFRVVM